MKIVKRAFAPLCWSAVAAMALAAPLAATEPDKPKFDIQAGKKPIAAERSGDCPVSDKAKRGTAKADAKRALDAFQSARTEQCPADEKKIAIQEEGANVKKEKGVEDVE